MSRQRPGVSGDPMNPRQPFSRKFETARHLMNMCRRFLDDKAGAHDIRSAFIMWAGECHVETARDRRDYDSEYISELIDAGIKLGKEIAELKERLADDDAALWRMRAAINKVRHLHPASDIPAPLVGVPTMVCDRKGGWQACPNHTCESCAFLGGRCAFNALLEKAMNE